MGVQGKRRFISVLVLMLAFSLVLAACSGKNSNEKGSTPTSTNDGATKPSDTASGTTGDMPTVDPVTLKVFYTQAGQTPPADNKMFKKIKDELGVTLDQEFLVGDPDQKIGVMIAGGEYPDMITANPKLVAAKAVIPLEDLIEKYAPNLKKHYEKFWNQMKDPSDGHIYWLPNYGVYQGNVNGTYYSGPAFWIQKAVLKEFGYPKIKTLDQYFDLIEKYKAKYPTIDGQPTIGYSTLAFEWRTFGLKNAPEHLAGYPNDGNVIVDSNNHAQIFANKDIAKRYFKKLNEIKDKGLMDKEAFTHNYDQYIAKLSSGRVLGMFDQHWNFGPAEDSLNTQNKQDRTYIGLPLVYDEGTKDYYRDLAPLNLGNGFGITIDAKDPERIIKFLDALMDEKWQKTLSWGFEGQDYQVGADGRFSRSDEQRKQQNDPTWKVANTTGLFFATLPKIEGSYSDGNATSPGDQPEDYFAGLTAVDKELFNAYGYKMPTDFFSAPPENRVSYPAWTIDLVEGSPAKVADTKMGDLALKYLPKAVLSKPADFDNVWADYVKAFDKIDVKAYEDRINEQLQYRQDNWGK